MTRQTCRISVEVRAITSCALRALARSSSSGASAGGSWPAVESRNWSIQAYPCGHASPNLGRQLYGRDGRRG
jgi:hypothetical protein